MQACRKWVDALPGVLWSYSTTPCFTTGETPFNLAFGADAVILAEAGLITFRIQHYEQENNNNLLRANLDLIYEVREDARSRFERYKQRIVSAYNRRVRRREFQVEDLVLWQAGALAPIGKLASNWEGPYEITRIIKFGAYELEDIDGRRLSRPWNASNLMKFYS
ncbi:UNVERIFIED_CONTAM: hypothetical protein Slati_2928500 [Sesamum latifolium]|uniref:Uncharacterized protein n=1 Tax=Sesamum latifolium TaxID=2727402 RepID=A0AAW2VE95_9LAMI